MDMLTINYDSLYDLFRKKLLSVGFIEQTAGQLATIFADNTRDGIISHGINRFPRFIEQIRDHSIDIDARPTLVRSFGAWEQWDGNHGVGPLNATKSMQQAMLLADQFGIGMVALRNTTHWMRGGTYGHLAAEQGYAAICWTNTTANMSPWNSSTHTIGNNPLVMALPGIDHPVVLDMAMSQYSYGKLETLAAKGERLAYPGGFDSEGKLTTDPQKILQTSQVLPIGMWKGSGLSIMLDLFASMLSDGASTPDIPTKEDNCSQFYLAISPGDHENRDQWIQSIRHSIKAMKIRCADQGETFTYPGEHTALRRRASLEQGIKLQQSMLDKVRQL
ncbi:3-dehydro-L-gulonate 2-dehydrogenase [Pleomorphochaeta sp. DL1XJH-081]|uniref:3-dehydro-L-gulonate 2-dehydrogenase n=1 Tax=Pleomorphochaeta sp. DL1XJH-081 TaxID=3409690 RepID=UPI003BB592D1